MTTETDRCTCCGATEPSDPKGEQSSSACACDISLRDDSDPAVGYNAVQAWCFTHNRRAD